MSNRGPTPQYQGDHLARAQAFVERHHRHHSSPVGHKLSIGVRIKGTNDLVGVAIVSRPVARLFDDGGDTLEVIRTCTDGTRNANSALYGAVWRICRELGAKRIITYTQDGETGGSLRAAGLHAGRSTQGSPRLGPSESAPWRRPSDQ